MTTALSVIRNTSPSPIPAWFNMIAPNVPDASIRDLLLLHNWYIRGSAPVFAEIGNSKLLGRVFVIPKLGSLLQLNGSKKEGVDKFAEKALFIDVLGRPSWKMLFSSKIKKGADFSRIADVSRLFLSRHILRLRHFQFANQHFLLSPLKFADVYSYFYDWKKTADPSRPLLDVFIGAFKGLSSMHKKGYVHDDLRNPRNILIERRQDGKFTGVLADLDYAHKPVATESRPLLDCNPGEALPAPLKPTGQDVLALLYSFLQTIRDMKRGSEYPNLQVLKSQIEDLVKIVPPAAEVAEELQKLRLALPKTEPKKSTASSAISDCIQ